MFTIAWPFALLLLPIPFIIRLLPPINSEQVTSIFAPFLTEYIAKAKQHNTNKNIWLSLLIWLLFILTLSRPQFLGEPIAIKQVGRDIQIAVDTSGSMRQTDMFIDKKAVTRLDTVKNVMNQFIAKRTGDRIGLILFGDKAYTQAPLTFDIKTVQTLLNESFIGIAGKSTAIDAAIALATKKHYELRESNQEADPILILITDGRSNPNSDPIQAAQFAKKVGLKVYTIGVGADRMKVNSFLGVREINPSEELDEKTLQQIANITGGKYFRAKNSETLQLINEAINKLEPISRKEQFFRPISEKYYIPLLAAILLLMFRVIPWRFKV